MARIILSRRNLLSLLHKLEMRDSARTIVKYDEDSNEPVTITVANDSDYYTDRPPGQMHPETEDFVEMLSAAIDRWRWFNGTGEVT